MELDKNEIEILRRLKYLETRIRRDLAEEWFTSGNDGVEGTRGEPRPGEIWAMTVSMDPESGVEVRYAVWPAAGEPWEVDFNLFHSAAVRFLCSALLENIRLEDKGRS